MSEKDVSEPAPHFEQTISVVSSDVDQLGHVNNVTYVRWVQDIAAAHWRAEAAEEDQKKLLWVVLRHEIDYKLPAFAGETLIVRTWVGEAVRLRFERHTEFVRSSDRTVVAKARTIWCPIDSGTGRPVAVSSQVRVGFSSRVSSN